MEEKYTFQKSDYEVQETASQIIIQRKFNESAWVADMRKNLEKHAEIKIFRNFEDELTLGINVDTGNTVSVPYTNQELAEAIAYCLLYDISIPAELHQVVESIYRNKLQRWARKYCAIYAHCCGDCAIYRAYHNTKYYISCSEFMSFGEIGEVPLKRLYAWVDAVMNELPDTDKMKAELIEIQSLSQML